jgi:hypothetical protein
MTSGRIEENKTSRSAPPDGSAGLGGNGLSMIERTRRRCPASEMPTDERDCEAAFYSLRSG